MDYQYDTQHLKIESVVKEDEMKEVVRANSDETVDSTEEISTKTAIMVVILMVIMYAMISAIPTFLLMHYADFSFWSAQLLFLIVGVPLYFLFGLHKPASDEQKSKAKFLL